MTRKERTFWKNKWFVRVTTLVIIIVGWQVVGSYLLNPLFISNPLEITTAFLNLLFRGGQYSIVEPTIPTVYEALAGFALAAVVGVPVGFLMGMFRTLDIAFNPYVNALYVAPRVAIIPLIVIWFGTGFDAIIFATFFLAVFPVLINTYAGVRDISKTMLDTAESFRVNGLRRFKYVTFPASLPFIMTGLRLGIGGALVGVVVAQMILSLTGLGYLLTSFGDFFDTAQLFAVMIELMAIGVVLVGVIELIERRLAHWKVTERAYQ